MSIKMASTPASSEVDPEEDTGSMGLDAQKTGRAAEYPDFAIIWSFLENFRHLLHFPDLSLDDLEDGFNSHSSENGNVEVIEELYKKLLRRIGISVNPEKWEKSLLKVVKEHGLLCAWDLEQFGYEELKVSSKLELFKVLLECQFDQNDKLKSSVNKGFDAEDLRMQPIGRDLDGFIYWFHEDDSNGVRLYTTEEDEVNCESWRLLAGETDELAAVVEFLESKSEVNPKEIALKKREEMKKKGEIKSPGKKKGKKGKKKESIVEEDYDDDNPCARCYSNVRPDSILLCDKCDAAYHTACLRPPLLTVPQGDWFCPFCQQLALLETLKEKLTRLAARMKLRQRQAKRLGFAGIDLNNILQRASDDEEDQGVRRSGRSRKNVDYTFREFEEDITSAVENDKKRFKAQEVNGEEKELLYSKPAYETGRLLDTGLQNTRRSRRLMDLDYESDSESKTSGYECEGNSDEEAQLASTWHGKLRRQRRVIDDDDDGDDVDDGNDNANNEVENASTKEPKVSETERDELLKEDKKVSGEDKKPSESVKSEEKIVNEEQTAKKTDDKESTKEDDKVTSSGSVAQVGVAAVFTTSQSQSTALSGNKIHPHSRIASVAPVARNQPTTDANNFRSTPGYPPEGVFPNPPNFNILKPQFPAEQAPNYLANMAATNITASANLAPSNVSGMLQGGSSFSGAEAVGFANTRRNFGGSGVSPPVKGGTNFPSPNLSFQNANVGGQSISGANFGGVNKFTPGSGGENNVSRNSFGGFVAGKTVSQSMPGSFWGTQNDFNSGYNYHGFPQSTGTTPGILGSPTNNQTLPPPYPSASQFAESSQYGAYNQQFQANTDLQNNFNASQKRGNFPDSSFFPAAPRQPPPPYTANNSLNVNMHASTPQGSSHFAGNQWTYPESYGYYPGQGSAAGQSF